MKEEKISLFIYTYNISMVNSFNHYLYIRILKIIVENHRLSEDERFITNLLRN